MLNYASICSGIEAPSVAWEPLGFKPVFFSEIEHYPSEVLAYRWPGVPNLGDANKFNEWSNHAVDILIAGTPCQSFSVAGLREGLLDPRGNLALVYLALIERYRPRWVVWENVPGVTSSWTDEEGSGRPPTARWQSNDFDTFTRGLSELRYGWCYRVLDSQYFGVAQRRSRVFVVGYLGDWRPAAAVLLEREGLRGDLAPSRQAGKGVAPSVTCRAGRSGGNDFATSGGLAFGDGPAGTLTAREKGGGGLGTDFDLAGGLVPSDFVPEIASCLETTSHDYSRADGFNMVSTLSGDDVARTLTARHDSSPCDDRGMDVVVQPCAFGWNKSESQTLRVDTETTDALQASPSSNPAVAIISGDADSPPPSLPPRILKERGGKEGGGKGYLGSEDLAFTLTTGQDQSIAMFKGGQGSKARGIGYSEDSAPTLTAANSGSNRSPNLLHGAAVRRLTPRECERLQGFPDDYTLIPTKRRNWVKELAEMRDYFNRAGMGYSDEQIIMLGKDSPRYKAIGNSMTVDTVRWIGEKIKKVTEVLIEQGRW